MKEINLYNDYLEESSVKDKCIFFVYPKNEEPICIKGTILTCSDYFRENQKLFSQLKPFICYSPATPKYVRCVRVSELKPNVSVAFKFNERMNNAPKSSSKYIPIIRNRLIIIDGTKQIEYMFRSFPKSWIK